MMNFQQFQVERCSALVGSYLEAGISSLSSAYLFHPFLFSFPVAEAVVVDGVGCCCSGDDRDGGGRCTSGRRGVDEIRKRQYPGLRRYIYDKQSVTSKKVVGCSSSFMLLFRVILSSGFVTPVSASPESRPSFRQLARP